MKTKNYIVTLIERDIETIKRNIFTIESHLKRGLYQEEIIRTNKQLKVYKGKLKTAEVALKEFKTLIDD